MRNMLAVPVAVFITIALVGCGSAPTTPTSTKLNTAPINTDIAVSDVYIIPDTYTLDSGTYTWNSGTYTWDFVPVQRGTPSVADSGIHTLESGTHTWNSDTYTWDFMPAHIGTNPVADSGTYTWNSSTLTWDVAPFDSARGTVESSIIEPKPDVIISADGKKYIIAANP
jgi:hypothetical protein